jgi:nitrate reductase delta subunit
VEDGVLPAARRAEIRALAGELQRGDPLEVEARYVELFDRGRSTSLHLFEHVHGDSRDRGPAMLDLIKTYEAGGLYLGDRELPDHLCVVLEFASTQAPDVARDFIGETAHILKAIFSALRQRESAYASLVAAVLELAGQKVEAVPFTADEDLDATWSEPEAFGGCSTQGQASPGQPQPIQIVRRQSTPAQGARA